MLKRLWYIINPVRLFWFIVYLIYLLFHVVIANLDVAYRVLHPEMPIKPGIVKFKTSLKSDLAKTVLANSITLTPGTLTIDIIDDYYYVHWIYVRSIDEGIAKHGIIHGFEKLLRRVFE
jgi:multicomponent Na+:H+ antiporter subunit E